MEINPEDNTEIVYDVALSFAGEQRDYVHRVALALRNSNIQVFYDKFEEDILWGKNLYEYLHQIYSKRAKYTVVFISKDYANKLWTSHEHKSAQERAFQESREYILPARFDDTSIPGIGDTIGYLDCTKRSPEQLAEIIAKKLGRCVAASHPPIDTIPLITFKDISFSNETLIGLLICAGTRSWCIASNQPLPDDALRLSSFVSIIPNKGEAFQTRQKQALSKLSQVQSKLEILANTIGCAIRLLSPLTLQSSTYDRFLGTDRQYILKTKLLIPPFTTPIPSDPKATLALISDEDRQFYAYPAPVDYVKDAFGIEVSSDKKRQDKKRNKKLFLRESTFLRNAKYLAINTDSNTFLAFAGVDKGLNLSATETSRESVVRSIQAAISSERRPVSLRSSSVIVETAKQKNLRESQVPVACQRCFDTKEVVVSYNLRDYSVPCPECNYTKDQTWTAFFERNGALRS